MKNVEQQLHDYFQSLPEAERAPAPSTAEFLDSTPTEPDMNNAPRTLAVAAVALIAFGIGLFAFLGGGDDSEVDVTDSVSTEPTTTTTTESTTTSSSAVESTESVDERAATLATVERFTDAFVAFDTETIILLADGESVTQPTLTWAAFNEALNMEFIDQSCEASGPQAAVCTLEHRDDLDALLSGPESTASTEISFFVADGKIVTINFLVRSSQNFGPALTWAGQQSEDADGGVCAQFGPSMPTPAACAEALVEVLQEWPERYGAETGG